MYFFSCVIIILNYIIQIPDEKKAVSYLVNWSQIP